MANIRRFAQEQGSYFFQEPTAPKSIDVKRRERVSFVTLRYPGGDRKLVLKNVTDNTESKRPSQILQVHQLIASENPELAAYFPKITGIDETLGWIAMEYIPGGTLEALLKRELLVGTRASGEIERYLADIARIFRETGKLNLGETHFSSLKWPNTKIVAAYDTIFTDSALRRYLPKNVDGVKEIFTQFGSDVFSRVYRSLVIVDCQPKNILVQDSGHLRLMDPDYSVANPALAVAHFLASLDRIGVTHLTKASQSKIAYWKSRLVAAYQAGADSVFAKELLFLYPWVLVRVCRWHVASRRWFGPYLRWYYGSLLRGFLTRMADTPKDRLLESPGEVFSPR